MKDQYVSVEHIFLALTDEKAGETARIITGNGMKKGAS